MKTVILYGDQKENEMDSAFIDILLPYTNLLYVSEKYIVKKQSDSKENTLIISCDKVPQIKNIKFMPWANVCGKFSNNVKYIMNILPPPKPIAAKTPESIAAILDSA